ncbi:MAG TPA: histidine phosphatase family protein [Methylotenera sp.]|nr:histidine phosphatase family protein [Methylotenera sp.]
MANLILWRHAEAENESATGEDVDRALTKRGLKDAEKMAKWLSQHLPADTEVLCSPARRCLETAAALHSPNIREIKIAEYLGVDSTVDMIAKKVSNDDSSQTILLIGHQPNLGLLIARLLGMNENSCVVKKGSVWWLRQRFVQGASQTYLFTVQHPDY